MNRNYILFTKKACALSSIAFLLALCYSCSNEQRFGAYTLTSNNVEDTIWLNHNFSESFTIYPRIDSSIISIRVSRKRVMQGFINAGPSRGAFAELLNVFSGFRNSDHNPNGQTKYFFFDGDNNGKLSDEKPGSALFIPVEYTSKQNNLHYEFKVIANAIKLDTNRNNFFVIFSDGETTIREQKNQNTTELSDLKAATKEILQYNPNIQIGILSLKADFSGDYMYDIDKSKNIECIRYLYALCFFDKKFLPEFDRMCYLNKTLGGTNFLFNPQLSKNLYQTRYLTEKVDGQSNKALNDFYVAYPTSMKGQDLEIKYQNVFSVTNIEFPKQVKLEANQYTQTDSLKFGNPKLIASATVDPVSEIVLRVPNLTSSCIIEAAMLPDFNKQLDSIVAKGLLEQDIANNTIAEVGSIKVNEILKTEGLREMLQMVLDALEETKKQPMVINFIQLGKYK